MYFKLLPTWKFPSSTFLHLASFFAILHGFVDVALVNLTRTLFIFFLLNYGITDLLDSICKTRSPHPQWEAFECTSHRKTCAKYLLYVKHTHFYSERSCSTRLMVHGGTFTTHSKSSLLMLSSQLSAQPQRTCKAVTPAANHRSTGIESFSLNWRHKNKSKPKPIAIHSDSEQCSHPPSLLVET